MEGKITTQLVILESLQSESDFTTTIQHVIKSCEIGVWKEVKDAG